VRADITDFFKGFLGVKRKFTNTEMTEQVEHVLVDTVRACADELPPEITSHVHERFVEMVDNNAEFDAPQFVAEYFGPHGNEKVERTFTRILDRRGLAGEAFVFDAAAVKPAQIQKYQTVEGVSLQVKEQAKDTVKIDDNVDGYTTILIRTLKLIQR